MVLFPNCKINLGLQIKGKRPDGYHDLESIFYPLNICDALEVLPISGETGRIEFTSSGLAIEGDIHKISCVQAYSLLKEMIPGLPSVRMHLHKLLPSGAGLGGGSSDGAFALRALNQKLQLDLSEQVVFELAERIGSDCPFFLINKPCHVKGRGEVLERVSIDLSPYTIILINPGIHISTAWAFRNLSGRGPSVDLASLITRPVFEWKDNLSNDFEHPVFPTFPEIRELKERLYSIGALYASMSGSGSSVYGIFPKEHSLPDDWPERYFVRTL